MAKLNETFTLSLLEISFHFAIFYKPLSLHIILYFLADSIYLLVAAVL